MKKDVRKKKVTENADALSDHALTSAATESAVEAEDRFLSSRQSGTIRATSSPDHPNSTVSRSATATPGTGPVTFWGAPANRKAAPRYPKMSEAMRKRWEKIRAGEMPHPDKTPKKRRGSVNPLFDLSEEHRAKLFAWLRECPYDDHVQQMLRDQGLPEATPSELNDFFQHEAEQHWEKRILRAAQEANALVQLAEKSPVKFSSGILAALGQEAFRQIASGQVEPDAMGKLATLFLKARSDERADQMQELKREKLRHELQDQIDHALERLAEEVDRHPVAREAFDALRKELAGCLEKVE